MKSEIEVKQHILKMLEDLMMGKSGSKFKPKEVEVEMRTEPSEGGLSDVLKKASADNPVEEEAEGPMVEEDEEEEEKPRMSLKDFLASK